MAKLLVCLTTRSKCRSATWPGADRGRGWAGLGGVALSLAAADVMCVCVCVCNVALFFIISHSVLLFFGSARCYFYAPSASADTPPSLLLSAFTRRSHRFSSLFSLGLLLLLLLLSRLHPKFMLSLALCANLTTHPQPPLSPLPLPFLPCTLHSSKWRPFAPVARVDYL